MTTTNIARGEKTKVLRIVEKTIGPTEKAGSGQEFTRTATFGKSWFHISFSGVFPLWYGIRPDQLDQAPRYKKSYFLFVMESAAQVLVVPAHRIRKIIKKHELEPKGSNEYQFHIQRESGGYHFLEAAREDLSACYNNYKSMLPKESPVTVQR